MQRNFGYHVVPLVYFPRSIFYSNFLVEGANFFVDLPADFTIKPTVMWQVTERTVFRGTVACARSLYVVSGSSLWITLLQISVMFNGLFSQSAAANLAGEQRARGQANPLKQIWPFRSIIETDDLSCPALVSDLTCKDRRYKPCHHKCSSQINWGQTFTIIYPSITAGRFLALRWLARDETLPPPPSLPPASFIHTFGHNHSGWQQLEMAQLSEV